MATNTTTPFRTVPRVWDKLEPAMLEPEPSTKHCRLQANRTYAMGQLVGPTAVTGVFASEAHGALAGNPLFPLVYPWATDANGYATLGGTVRADDTKNESVEYYYIGAFNVADIVGLTDVNLPRVGSLYQGSVDTVAHSFSTDAIVKLG
jgi:hypothetical protein